MKGPRNSQGRLCESCCHQPSRFVCPLGFETGGGKKKQEEQKMWNVRFHTTANLLSEALRKFRHPGFEFCTEERVRMYF